MAYEGYQVADSDMHVMEPADLWQHYIDPAFKHAAPIGLTEMPRDMRMRVKSHILLRGGAVHRATGQDRNAWRKQHETAFAEPERRGWDAQSQLDAMNAEGLDLAVIFPSRGLFVLGLDTVRMMGSDGLEDDFAAAIARAYNDWAHDFCKIDGARIFGAGLIAPHNVAMAIEEARRCVQELGFKTVFMGPGLVDRRPWHHPDYDPLWAECEKLGVPVCFHGGGRTHLQPDYSLGVFNEIMLWHTFNQPLGIMATVASLTGGGVIARFPKLRFGLLEGNCSWAPWLMHRLDEHWEWMGHVDAPDVEKKPSEYFLSNCFLSCEADEATAKHYVDWFGDANLVYSTDYPHADSKFPNSVQQFLGLDLPDSSKRKILWDNWGRLYGVDLVGK